MKEVINYINKVKMQTLIIVIILVLAIPLILLTLDLLYRKRDRAEFNVNLIRSIIIAIMSPLSAPKKEKKKIIKRK